MRRIEDRANMLRSDGSCHDWLADADPSIRTISTNINGPALLELAREINYHDPGCVQLFHKGGPLVGSLTLSGNGVLLDPCPAPSLSVETLVADRFAQNNSILDALR